MLTTMEDLNVPSLLIGSVQEGGGVFRPSDWVERLSGALAVFGPDQRLRYAPSVRPMMRGKEKCLMVQMSLLEQDPGSFEFILKFARDNRLRIEQVNERSPGSSVAPSAGG